MKSIIQNDRYSNKSFKKWLINQSLSTKEFEDFYNAYRLIRDNKKVKNLNIKLEIAEKVLNILDSELKLLEAQIHGKSKEKASERNRLN